MSADDILGFGEIKSKMLRPKKGISGPLNELQLRFDGFNEEFTKIYYWHMQFAYYVDKGYVSFKLEDQQYFSESSQFGSGMRQIKGGSIRAYQENFQQVVTLIRQHLLPLLKEVKESHFYKLWFDKITVNDRIVCAELNKSSPNAEVLNKARNERNEAISHMKDKWVNEVEGGRMWQMNRSATEQGLDFALLPQLFFGVALDDPFQQRRTLKEQLDDDVYPIDISTTAKEAVARQMYKFHTWLPTAIKDTEVTFKLKVSALKNVYVQVQMYINFMKPILQEISAKSEGFSKEDFYSGYESENAEIVNILDSSYNMINVMGVGKFIRAGKKIEDLEFSKYGFFLGPKDIVDGKFKGKSGFVCGLGDSNEQYIFYPCDNKNISNPEYLQLRRNWKQNPTYLMCEELEKWSVMTMKFSQKRRMENFDSPQGPVLQPFMRNTINYTAYAWNIYEVASYRAGFKEENIQLMESFINELAVVKEDLMTYVNYFDAMDEEFVEAMSEKDSKKKSASKNSSSNVLKDSASPIFGLGELFSPFIPKSSGSSKSSSGHHGVAMTTADNHLKAKLAIVEDVWKVYRIFKKSNGFLQY